ncbi:hypothetical protein FA868_01570 [Escherichia coli]|nr:hypothetical protein [Escherichia coli]
MSPNRLSKVGYHPTPRRRLHRHFCKTISTKSCLAEKVWLRRISACPGLSMGAAPYMQKNRKVMHPYAI